MASEVEKRGMAELLERMASKDLNSLAQTVTNRLILPESPAEAIQTIILHTGRPTDLLKRKKITRDLLFKYLNSKQVPIEGNASKTTCVRNVLELWGSSDACLDMIVDDDLSLDSPPPAPTPSRDASHTSLCSLDQSHSRDGFPTSYLSNIQSYLSSGSHSHPYVSNGPSLSSHNQSNHQLTINQHNNNTQQLQPPSDSGVDVGLTTSRLDMNPVGSSSPSQSQCQDMADTFVEWYYDRLNNCLVSDNPEFDSRHFFPDANAKIELISNTGESAESHHVMENGAEVSSLLRGVVTRHRLHHNPNICDAGVKGFLDPHGLVMVLACGTLHNQHTVCGTFEQVFGLARDPNSDNNWKIKHTQARLIAKNVTKPPSLANTSLHALCYS